MKRNEAFQKRYGPWAVVAGGSEGLGGAFAEELAQAGMNLVLIARRPGPLAETAARLRTAHGVEVRTLGLDLADRDAVSLVMRETADREVGLLVCNAAIAYTGEFLEGALEEYDKMLAVNCGSTVGLIHGLGGKMVQRRHGGIIVMSSMAAFQGSPMVAAYGATKAYLLALAEALADEFAPLGVDVLASCPAVVLTPGFLTDGHDPKGPAPLSMEPAAVARETLQSLGRKRILVPGVMTKIARIALTRLMPRAATVALMGRSTRAMYGKSKR